MTATMASMSLATDAACSVSINSLGVPWATLTAAATGCEVAAGWLAGGAYFATASGSCCANNSNAGIANTAAATNHFADFTMALQC
jgi:hypothetical protein